MADWLPRAIAPAAPYMALCLTEADFRTALSDLGVATNDDWVTAGRANATCHHFRNTHNGGLAAVVCMRDWQGREPTSVAALLVHEAVHIWQAYRGDLGESRPGREQEAYGIQYIAGALMEAFAEQIGRHQSPPTASRPASP